MINKSKENLEIAQTLINKRLYNASVHCTYYGCFQYIKYVLNMKNILLYDEQNKNRPDSHIHLMQSMYNKINSDKIERAIRTNYESLRDKRKIADYEIDFIGEDDGLRAMEEANRVISNIKRAFGGNI